jgi:hypothetical protein
LSIKQIEVRAQYDALLIACIRAGHDALARLGRQVGREARDARRNADEVARAADLVVLEPLAHQNSASPASTKIADSCASCRCARPYCLGEIVSRCRQSALLLAVSAEIPCA